MGFLFNGGDLEGMALDIPSQRIYYTDEDSFQVRRVDFAGTNDTLLFTDVTNVWVRLP